METELTIEQQRTVNVLANIGNAGSLIAEALLMSSSLPCNQENLENTVTMVMGMAVRYLKQKGITGLQVKTF